MKKDLTELIYGASLRTAGKTKEQHFRRWVETFNRDLVEKIVCGWDEKDRRKQYRLAVLPYWKRYGRRPKSFWFELAGSRDHAMDPRYIPSDLYYLELLPYLNNFNFARATEDKNYLDLRFPDVKQAKTVCRRMAGEYYDGSMELIRQDDAVRLCREHPGTLFIKPSVYSGCGGQAQTAQAAEPASAEKTVGASASAAVPAKAKHSVAEKAVTTYVGSVEDTLTEPFPLYFADGVDDLPLCGGPRLGGAALLPLPGVPA